MAEVNECCILRKGLRRFRPQTGPFSFIPLTLSLVCPSATEKIHVLSRFQNPYRQLTHLN
jgi:hypothetical protein